VEEEDVTDILGVMEEEGEEVGEADSVTVRDRL
jgi:hypothetical protein